MVFKRGNPVTTLISLGFSVLGGVFFPIGILPKFAQFFSYLIPITYSLRSLRLALLKGYSMSYFYSDILILLLFIIILLPIGLLSFNFAVRKAKIDGSLIHY
jgi:ABC-2 type transport system permease protein